MLFIQHWWIYKYGRPIRHLSAQIYISNFLIVSFIQIEKMKMNELVQSSDFDNALENVCQMTKLSAEEYCSDRVATATESTRNSRKALLQEVARVEAQLANDQGLKLTARVQLTSDSVRFLVPPESERDIQVLAKLRNFDTMRHFQLKPTRTD